MIRKVKEGKEGKEHNSNFKITGGEVIFENSPVGESQSNGTVESDKRSARPN